MTGNPPSHKKELTITEFARMGGKARAERHSKAQLRRWAKKGGRPPALDSKARAKLERLLRQGKSQGECARTLGVSTRTIGRYYAAMSGSTRSST